MSSFRVSGPKDITYDRLMVSLSFLSLAKKMFSAQAIKTQKVYRVLLFMKFLNGP